MVTVSELKKIEKHVRAIFNILGIEETESNTDTPKRVAKMYGNELFKNLNMHTCWLDREIKVFDNTGSNNPVVMKGIKFSSVCEHHWLPFFGTVDVSYTPKDKIIGLSKIPRIVNFFSKKPQLQEKLTREIGEYLVNILNPVNLEVKITSTHTCVMCRGVESDCQTETHYSYHSEV